MKRLNVVLEIELDAETFLEGAKQVEEWIKNGDDHWQYYVQDKDTKEIVSVDLQEPDEDAVLPVTDYKPLIQM